MRRTVGDPQEFLTLVERVLEETIAQQFPNARRAPGGAALS
ncbi:MAG TPA: hypothetical protein VLU96_10995 [Gaiellaceae bacterium]|nr:hypothetical protein [Gaiellaceae bacterium]